MTLPPKPGLYRRLAYGDQIRHRNRRRNFLSINLFPEQNYNLINQHMSHFNRGTSTVSDFSRQGALPMSVQQGTIPTSVQQGTSTVSDFSQQGTLPTSNFSRQGTIGIPYTYEQLVTLEDVQVGLNTKDLVRNSKISLNENSFLCSICQDNDEVIIRILKCNHYFHITCIDKWLSNNKTCPVCRYNLEN